jgi:hypothetical protein
MPDRTVAAAWDEEYRRGRFLDDPPLPFVAEIIATARAHGLESARGVYIGCGNGRNYLPLVASGLDLVGLDISPVAIAQLTERAPTRAARLICGDVEDLPPGVRYPVVIALQVFQHGDQATAHAELGRARDLVAPGGLFCVRVNAIGTDIEYPHTLEERGPDGRFTIRYRAGPKSGLRVHFYTAGELQELIEHDFAPVRPLREEVTERPRPQVGSWAQWEGIWARRTVSSESAGPGDRSQGSPAR